MKKYVGFAFVILGVILIAYPFYRDYSAKKWQERLISAYIDDRTDYLMTPEELLDQLTDAFDDNDEIDSDPQEATTTKKNKDVIGIIYIDKINVKLPILYDATKSNLNKGATMVKGTSFPFEDGNTAIAAHRGSTYGIYFNRLNELKEGDEIVLKFLDVEYRYVVYDKFLVLPNEVWVLNDIEGEHIVTLITCDPPSGNSTHRLIVRGRIK